jgi:hypothetical protein
MTKWGIFKCQNCGKRFKEKFKPECNNWNERQVIDPEHIGRYTHIVATHHCKENVYGCGKLIGVELRTRKAAQEAEGEKA